MNRDGIKKIAEDKAHTQTHDNYSNPRAWMLRVSKFMSLLKLSLCCFNVGEECTIQEVMQCDIPCAYYHLCL